MPLGAQGRYGECALGQVTLGDDVRLSQKRA